MNKQKSTATKRFNNAMKTILLSATIVCFAATAFASDAVRLFLELSSTTATVWPGGSGKEYIRGRVVCLDESNDLATTFAASSITSSQLVFESKNFGSNARFSILPSTELTLAGDDWKPASQTVSVPLEHAWQEFAISYDNISMVDNDTFVLTLKYGAETISVERTIKVKPPEANCYVVRTGGKLSLNVLDEIPARQEDGGSTKLGGDATTVDVYAGFYNAGNKKYYYTSRLPEGEGSVKISSPATTVTLI
ncbi:MAG: hypothetical protein WCQ99_17085, partial [Pseudomonadota bacterium]